MSLASCQTTSNREARVTYPSELFRCMAAPEADSITSDNQLAVFIAELAGAHKDCQSRLQNLEPLLNREPAK